MKKLILTIIFYFSLTFICLAVNNTDYYCNSSTSMNLISNHLGIDIIEQNNGIEIVSYDLMMDENSCTISIEGSIGVSGTTFKVSISVTADSCSEARELVREEFEALKEMIREFF